MPSLKDFSIKHPQFANAWRLVCNKDCPDLSMQAVKFSYDLVNKTLSFSISQSADGVEHMQLQTFLENKVLWVECMRNFTPVIGHIMCFQLTKVLKHEFMLDYSTSEIATHNIVVGFDSLTIRHAEPG